MGEPDAGAGSAQYSAQTGLMAPIGILGGTFDPVHCGHLRTALDVAEDLGLANVHLVPLHVAVHRAQPIASVADRWEMVRRAADGIPEFVADDRELRRDGYSYTVETLHSFRTEFGANRPLCLLLGTDAFEGFAQWHKPELITELAHLIVMQRPGYQPPNESIPTFLTAAHGVHESAVLRTQPGGMILFHTVTQLEISSSDIRTRIAAGLSARFLVPDNVLQVLENQRLYRADMAYEAPSPG